MKLTTVGLWGDSIGKGVVYDEARGRYTLLKENCVSLLSARFSCVVENHAAMGATAAQGLERMNEGWLRRGGVAVIEYGGNDCDMPWKDISERPGEEHRPRASLEEFSRALDALVKRAGEGGMEPVLVTPPPLDAERYFSWVSRGLNAGAILSWLGDVQRIYRWQERYAVAVRDAAARTGARLLDLRDAFLNVGSLGDYFCLDGIHPNAKGHELLARAAEKQLCGLG